MSKWHLPDGFEYSKEARKNLAKRADHAKKLLDKLCEKNPKLKKIVDALLETAGKPETDGE